MIFLRKNKKLLLQSLTIKKNFSNKLSRNLFFKDLSLKERDAEMFEYLEQEKMRQWIGIELIASENYAGKSVLECLGSVLTNKYSEGYPGNRYYGGNEYIDKIENLARSRALQAFHLNPEDWGVNVQSYSGSPANFATYTALIKPGEKIMGLDLYSGGHLTHGFQTETKKISATSLYFQSKSYKISEDTGLIDFDQVQKTAEEFRPNIIIVGASAYPRDFDYGKFRKIADSINAYLLADISHISGLVASKEQNSPFELCDVVTTTTHKSLRGPRSGMIFFNKKRDPTLEERVNFAVFPMLQGGPHNHQIGALATQLKEVLSDEFKEYSKQVKRNAKSLSQGLMDRGMKLITDGTDNHLMQWDVRPLGLTGSKVEKVCDMVHITVNKNTIVGDKSAMNPGGVRIGTPAITSRGMNEKDMLLIAEFLSKVTKICLDAQNKGGKNLKQFLLTVEQDPELEKLGREVKDFATQFYIPGVSEMYFDKDYKI